MNLTQVERVKSELKRRKYEHNKISGNLVIIFEHIFSFKIKENELKLLCGLGVILKKIQGSKHKN